MQVFLPKPPYDRHSFQRMQPKTLRIFDLDTNDALCKNFIATPSRFAIVSSTTTFLLPLRRSPMQEPARQKMEGPSGSQPVLDWSALNKTW